MLALRRCPCATDLPVLRSSSRTWTSLGGERRLREADDASVASRPSLPLVPSLPWPLVPWCRWRRRGRSRPPAASTWRLERRASGSSSRSGSSSAPKPASAVSAVQSGTMPTIWRARRRRGACTVGVGEVEVELRRRAVVRERLTGLVAVTPEAFIVPVRPLSVISGSTTVIGKPCDGERDRARAVSIAADALVAVRPAAGGRVAERVELVEPARRGRASTDGDGGSGRAGQRRRARSPSRCRWRSRVAGLVDVT